MKTASRHTSPWAWGVLAGILLLIALVLWWAPEERTLGQGIKTVYLHVGLTWAGMAGLAVAAILGAGVLITSNRTWLSWMQTVGWVGTLIYGAGIGMSMAASKANWGAVFLQEPRMAAALNGLAIALIVQLLNGWLPWRRVRGLLSILLILLIVWLNGRATLVLHPPNPVRTSPSQRIQLAFLALFSLCSLVAAWLVWYFRPATDARPDISTPDA